MAFDLMTQTHAAPFVVLSPGCSGANWVAATLHGMGVKMGDKFRVSFPDDPGAFEDLRLRDLDSDALARKISTREWLLRLLTYCEDRGAAGTQWGMNDPRLCDLAPWLRHGLPHGRFIRVVRPLPEAIAECEMVYGPGAGPKVARDIITRRVRMLDEHFPEPNLTLTYRQARDRTVLFPMLRDFVKEKAYNLVTT